MKLSKAQSVSINVIEAGIKAGFVSGVPLVFIVAMLTDAQSIIGLVGLLFLPCVIAGIGSVVGCVLLVVSTIIRVLLSK